MFAGPIFGFLTSRTGIILSICLALFTWHKLDKGSAVREAVIGYVADVELQAANAEAEALRVMFLRVQASNAILAAEINQAEQEAEDVRADFKEYIRNRDPNALNIVDRDLLDVLRSD